MADMKFLVFSDLHYKKKMYPASVKDLEAILERANSESVDFVIHCGDFSNDYLVNIKYYCLVMTKKYIENHFDDILGYANVIEKRLCDDCTKEGLINDNMRYMELADKHNLPYILINDMYYRRQSCRKSSGQQFR